MATAPHTDDFADWVTPHLPSMARLAARFASPADRDDVLQEALANAWRKRGQFDPRRGEPLPWLLAIVADQAYKATRRSRHVAELTDVHPVTADPRDIDLERAVRRLAPRQRMAVALHYFVDLPVATVAQVMGCSEGTVKSTLSEARTALRNHLGKDYR